jgi:hypothetical protein
MDARDCLVSYVVPVYNKALTYRQVRPGACLAADHPVRQQGVPLAPGGEALVDVDERGQQPMGHLERRLVAVERDEQRGNEGVVRQPAVALVAQLVVAVTVEDRLEGPHGRLVCGELFGPALVVQAGVLTDDACLALEHVVDRGAVLAPEVEPAPAHERGALEPVLDVRQQRRLLRRLFDQIADPRELRILLRAQAHAFVEIWNSLDD